MFKKNKREISEFRKMEKTKLLSMWNYSVNYIFLLHTFNEITNAKPNNLEIKASNNSLKYLYIRHFDEFCNYFLEFLNIKLL